jgi:GT2 family glycosyltransferase
VRITAGGDRAASCLYDLRMEQAPDDPAPSSARTVPVSVAITTRDRPEALARCLRSLAAGSALPAEVVVVDQSRDASAGDVVDAAELPGVRHLPQAATGLSIGQNAAVEQTTLPVVAVLDDDCVADVDWIAQVAEALAPAAPADVIGGRVLPLADARPGLFPVATRTSTTPRTFVARTTPWDIGSGNNFAFRREWFDRVGGCDPRLGAGSAGRAANDIDLFYRLLRAGARVRYEPNALVYHEQTTRSGRLGRRVPYGFGMGAACSLWLRQRDPVALRVLANWIALRVRLLAGAVRQRRLLGVWEELLVLSGTARGLLYGLRAPEPIR